ncbi:hypothetical protein AB0D49_20650 [Streptomyces sp. NPDC048290]|uniref:hypothetical protein n=1 Tax=Streptomyces sp. NPDC048290 TaxID=3155811 RepID=UPI0034327B9B
MGRQRRRGLQAEAGVDKVRVASATCADLLLGLFGDEDAPAGDPERFGVILLAALHGIAALAAADSLPPQHRPDDLAAEAVRQLLRGARAD